MGNGDAVGLLLLTVIPPGSFNRIRAHLTAMSVLAEFGVRPGSELDHIAAFAVLDAENLDIDRACPVIPASVLLAVDVDVRCTELVGKAEFAEFVLLDAVEAFRWRGSRVLWLGFHDCWCHCGSECCVTLRFWVM